MAVSSENEGQAAENPIGGALYWRPGLRGRWRCEKAGPKWVTLRSLMITNCKGAWMTVRVAREDWPNEWQRVGDDGC